MTSDNHYLRHTIATIAYRFQNALHEANDDFGDFSPGKKARTTCEIINHMSQLLRASTGIIKEETFSYNRMEKQNLHSEVDRFNRELIAFDKILIEEKLTEVISNRLLQGPISDILTHIGQLSLMRRLNGNPVGRGGFSKAPIPSGNYPIFKNTQPFFSAF